MCLSTLHVEYRFFTHTLLIQFPALNLIDNRYFDSCSWGLFDSNDINNSFNKEQNNNKKSPSAFYLLFKLKRINFFCHGQNKTSYLHCQQGDGSLDAY